MNDLQRLLDASRNRQTRALLHAGSAESAPAEFAQRVLVGVSAAAAAGGLASAAAAATTGKVGGLMSGVSLSGSTASSAALVVAKWVAVGVLGGGILAAGADYAFSPPPQKAAISAPVELPVLAAPQALPVAPAAPATPVAVPVAEVEPLVSAAPGRPRADAAPLGTQSGQLGREVELIDRARRALAAGNTALALSQLDAFERIASTGALNREARVLRIQALRKAGDVEATRLLTEQYLREFPGDAHGVGLRAQEGSKSP